MIGTKIQKIKTTDESGNISVSYDKEQYKTAVDWCNENSATIEDKGEYYEVVKIPQLTFDDLKRAKYQEVKDDYLKALYSVAWVDQDGNLYGYDTDPGSQLDFSLSHVRAKLNGTTRYNVYTDKSNLDTKEFLEHTPEMFDKVLTEVGNLQKGIYVKYYAVKELVKVAQTPEELAEISFDMEVPVDGQ